MKQVSSALVATFVCLLTAAPAGAQTAGQPADTAMSFGVRAGVSAQPNQFVVGGHIESPRLGVTRTVSLRPNVEIGFGDDVTLLTGNLEIVRWFEFPNSPWTMYVGGGPSLNWLLEDEGDVGGGATLLVGLQHAQGLFFEMKAGGGFNAPTLKGIVGFTLSR